MTPYFFGVYFHYLLYFGISTAFCTGREDPCMVTGHQPFGLRVKRMDVKKVLCYYLTVRVAPRHGAAVVMFQQPSRLL